MEDRRRVFAIDIKASPERIWHALTSGEDTQKYFFGRRVESDWKVGSSFTFWDGSAVDVTGKVLESEPPSRLVVSWTVPRVEELKGMPPSRVTYTIQQFEGFSRLTVIEEVPDEIPEKFLEGGKKGWPNILESLKKYLEEGGAL